MIGLQDVPEDSSSFEPICTSHPVESDDEMSTSEIDFPASDDVYEEEAPEESTETETEDEANVQHQK